MKNHGYIEQVIEPKDWVLGGVSAMPKVVERPDGQWGDFLPVLEIQRYGWGDSMACVSFSFLNALETLLKKRGEQYNFSDRVLAKASGTTVNGNSMRKVADTARKFGLVEEGNWPASDTVSWQDFYKPLSATVVSTASMFAQGHKIQYETVFAYPEQMCEALMYSPLQIAMYAYGEVKDGIYLNPGNKQSNHCVILFEYEFGKYWKIYDQYENKFKKLAWDYNISFIYRVNIEKTMPEKNPLGLANNTHVMLVEAPGAFGIHLDGNIIVDDEAKLNSTFIHRNSLNGTFHGGPTRQLTKAQWDQYPKINLKGQPLT